MDLSLSRYVRLHKPTYILQFLSLRKGHNRPRMIDHGASSILLLRFFDDTGSGRSFRTSKDKQECYTLGPEDWHKRSHSFLTPLFCPGFPSSYIIIRCEKGLEGKEKICFYVRSLCMTLVPTYEHLTGLIRNSFLLW